MMQPQGPIDPNLRVPVTLTLGEWEAILDRLADSGTYRQTAPMIQKLAMLVGQAANMMAMQSQTPANGHDDGQMEMPIGSQVG